MKKIVSIDMTAYCKKFETALNRFMKKYTGHEEWIETYEWMYENGVDFFCDNVFAGGTENKDWCYALHLDVNEDSFYFGLIERA